jgi:hypothetical protein
MLETFLLIIVLPASIILNIILINRGIAYIKLNEQLTDIVKEYDARQDTTLMTLESMIDEMRQIDLNGSFESDDEVGTVFTELKNTIESYKTKI